MLLNNELYLISTDFKKVTTLNDLRRPRPRR